MIKFFIGPMSKNVVDAILEFNDAHKYQFGLIPSRRQVDRVEGYANGWNSMTLANYVSGRAIIERDHGGIGQGDYFDLGFRSFKLDEMFFNIIHIDPWKVIPDLEYGIEYTNYVINKLGNKVKYEIGTEEAIRNFTVGEFKELLNKIDLSNVEYAVVQSGVGLDLVNKKNTGSYDKIKLENMIYLCQDFSVKSKEHNGDYLSNDDYKKRFDLGLDSINIAPEFGQIETQCYLDEMKGPELHEYFEICSSSGKWKKWIAGIRNGSDLSAYDIISICGHYVLSEQRFLDIKPNIDDKIKAKITEKLEDLCSL